MLHFLSNFEKSLMARLLRVEVKVIQPRIARVFTNGRGFAGEFCCRFYSCLFAQFVVQWAVLGIIGGPRGTSAVSGKENPGSHRQPLQEMISSWLGVTGVRAEEMSKSRKFEFKKI
jgi:hypothetical protein